MAVRSKNERESKDCESVTAEGLQLRQLHRLGDERSLSNHSFLSEGIEMSDELAMRLIRRGLAEPDQIREAEAVAQERGVRLADAMISLGYCSDLELAEVQAELSGLSFFDLEKEGIVSRALELVPESLAREKGVIPVRESIDDLGNSVLTLAISDPKRVDVMDAFRYLLNQPVEFVVAGSLAIRDAINRHYLQSEGESIDSIVQEMTSTQIEFEYISMDSASAGKQETPQSPAARIVDLMIGEALQVGASDVHIEPFGDRVQVRYRIDGQCQKRSDLPRRTLASVVSRIMVLAGMDMTQRRTPSDGRIRTQVGDRRIDLRVSIVPTNHGLSCVMRLLDCNAIRVGLNQLGMSTEQLNSFRQLTRRSNGLILVTGPTGSGKSTTLYAALKSLNTPYRKIITAEEPVEYNLPGVNQVEVDSRHLDFASVIRSMLRQAPNVILIGEMRDRETTDVALQAAQTGHLVFSTLHANDSVESISRLEQLGIKRYQISSGVIGVLSQRLVRKVCDRCKTPRELSPQLQELTQLSKDKLSECQFVRGKGCNHCKQTGYRGRLGVYELLTIDSEIRGLIDGGASSIMIRRTAVRRGMTTLYRDGIQKASQGITSIEEVLSATRAPTLEPV